MKNHLDEAGILYHLIELLAIGSPLLPILLNILTSNLHTFRYVSYSLLDFLKTS